ncbi:uncharacterized protein LOC129730160 isoform X2 [Wyeomyia smithii]|uniref:uncharacterized protein LOC129730160 isoform X2 n=1 Tax=Wyeomyia smithii TaxID=174621 RepID=UPI0024681FDA|nr:uncharacterized protein LOC129730160 isoform X2 [Wyeomyia smithii]
MNEFYYLDISLKLAAEPDQLLPVYFKSCLEQALVRIFGEIGGQTTVDLLKFDTKQARAIVRVPSNIYVKLRSAIALIGQFQDIPCSFNFRHNVNLQELW